MRAIKADEISKFVTKVWAHFDAHKRDMPWRVPTANGQFDPYKIMVSELMLQQTQVSRVIPKYQAFMVIFPDVKSLAQTELAIVLRLWQGLGYNRRAKYIWEAARIVMGDYGGQFPATITDLVRLPGVGPNTAGAIMAYAFDQPVVFVETNIRSVYIHHFFGCQALVSDAEVREQVLRTLPPTPAPKSLPTTEAVPRHGVREWYWALMDYGAYLKATSGNAARRSAHYSRQSPLEGSVRLIRGRVLRLLSAGAQSRAQITKTIGDDRLASVLASLESEGLITKKGTRIVLG